MAIQLRRGAYADFDPTKMVPAEVGIVTSGDPNTDDGKAAYVAFSAGNAKRIATVEDIATDLQDATDDAVEQATARAEAAAESVESSATQIATNTADIADLKADMQQLYDATTVDDMYGENTTVVRVDNVLTSATWDTDTKTLSVIMSGSASSADSYYVVLSPKFIANHIYKIAIKYIYPVGSSYTYIRNVFGTLNFNSRDDIVDGEVKYNNAEEVFTLSATSDGWLALATRVPANTQRNWSWKLAVYDVTGIDISDVSDSDFLSFADNITVGTSGIIPQTQAKAEYIYPLVSNVKGETWTALGDSLTAQGSGSQYLEYVKSKLGLADYYNCGIGGTAISGATRANAMYQDVRINALNLGSNAVTILGGTNDAWQEYYKDHPSENLTGWGECVRTNHDVSTFCGAYNVMLSKIFYKFCKVNGYYEDVDYSGITQVTTAIDNFRVILMTPPQAFHVEGDSMSANLQLKGLTAAHSYVKQIAELWSLPCVDTWEMGMNDMNRSLFFANYLTDATHFNAFGHKRLASLLINKAIQVSRYK